MSTTSTHNADQKTGKLLPLYKQIANELRQEIQANYEPSMSLPPQRTLAKQYKTSYVTVGKAINELVHEGLLTRTVGAGTFVKENKPVSRDLISVLTSCADPYYRMTLFANIEARLRQERYRPILFGSNANFEEERKAFNDIGHMNENGIIIYSFFHKEFKREIKSLIDRGIPVVSILKPIEGADCIRTDHRMIGMLQGQYIAQFGLRNTIYIGRDCVEYGVREREGFLTSLSDAGIKMDKKNIFLIEPPTGSEGEKYINQRVYEIVNQTLDAQPNLEAITIWGDRYIPAIMQALNEKGRKPGRDIVLVSADNQDLPGIEYATVDEGHGMMGNCAAEMIIERIQNKYSGPPRIKTILPKLIEHKG